MISCKSLEEIKQNNSCYEPGWIYVFKRKHHVKIGRTKRSIIERLNDHKVQGKMFDIACYKTEYNVVYERVILAYIKNVKYTPINGNEYFDPNNYTEIIDIVSKIFAIPFTHVMFVYNNHRNNNKELLNNMFNGDYMKEKIKGYNTHKFNELYDDDEESELSNMEESENSENESEQNESEETESEEVKEIKSKNYCEFCNKKLANKFTLKRHYETCDKKLEFINNKKENELRNKYNKELKKEYDLKIKKLEAQIKEYEKKMNDINVKNNSKLYELKLLHKSEIHKLELENAKLLGAIDILKTLK